MRGDFEDMTCSCVSSWFPGFVGKTAAGPDAGYSRRFISLGVLMSVVMVVDAPGAAAALVRAVSHSATLSLDAVSARRPAVWK